MWSQFTNVTDRQTDRQTTCDRNTALCTKVHQAVIREPFTIYHLQLRTLQITSPGEHDRPAALPVWQIGNKRLKRLRTEKNWQLVSFNAKDDERRISSVRSESIKEQFSASYAAVLPCTVRSHSLHGAARRLAPSLLGADNTALQYCLPFLASCCGRCCS